MKSKILFLFVALLITTGFSEAQLIKNSKASECVKQATTFAEAEGYTSPEVIAIGTMAGDLNVGQLPLQLNIDVKAGTGTAWLFIMTSKAKPDSTLFCGVVKTALGTFMSVRMPGDNIPDMEVDVNAPLTPYKWMDSDKLYAYLSKDDTYNGYMTANTDAKAMILALAVADIGTQQPTWVLMLEGKVESLSCIIHAETGEVMCFALPTSVNDNISSNISVYPNPTADMVYINIPVENQVADSKMILTDYTGNVIKELFVPKYGESTITALNAGDLTNGVYFIRYISSKGSFVKSFTVSK